tara:strand:+ start:1629 stop:1991 length:363 start_codon:yes stop_codon:yes gene_type:complete
VDGAIDIKTVMTVAAMIASVAGAAAVARLQIKELAEKLSDIEVRLRKMDSRADKLWTTTETQETRLNVLAGMASPENERRDHRAMATLEAFVSQLRLDVSALQKQHNGKHPPVASERKAD